MNEKLMDKIILYLIYGLPFALFIGKSYKILTGLIVVAFLSKLFTTKNYTVLQDKIFLVLISWCLYLGFSALWAVHPTDTLTGTLELSLWIFLYLALTTTLSTEERIQRFVTLQAWVIIFIGINSMVQYTMGFNFFGVALGTDNRVTDLIDTRKTIGHLLPVWIGIFGAVLALPMQNKKNCFMILLALVLLLITMPLTGTRGPLVIMAIFLPLIAWVSPYRKYALSLLGIIISIAVILVSISPVLQQRLETLQHPFENQKHYRIPIWLTAIEEFKDNPITGVGFHNYRYRVLDYYQDSFESYEINPKTGQVMNHAHNPWMDILAEQGLIGLCFALTLLLLIAKDAYALGPIVVIGSMGIWYTFSILNSTFVLSSDRWSFFMIFSISIFFIIKNLFIIKRVK